MKEIIFDPDNGLATAEINTNTSFEFVEGIGIVPVQIIELSKENYEVEK